MSVNAVVTGGKITATVSSDVVSASVSGTAPVAAEVTGATGPQGPVGPAGSIGRLVDLQDVNITSASVGDVLRYNGTAWTDYHENNLTDGGAF